MDAMPSDIYRYTSDFHDDDDDESLSYPSISKKKKKVIKIFEDCSHSEHFKTYIFSCFIIFFPAKFERGD